jgi:hypothetical protein
MSLISSLPFCVEEFESLSEVYDTIITPYFNQVGGPHRTGFKGTLFPLALTRDQVHALYWRVVSIELDYEASDVYNSRAFPVGAAEVPVPLLGSDTNTAIIKRVCGDLRYLTYTSAYSIEGIDPNDLSDHTQFLSLFDFRSSGGVAVPRCVKVENTYYPFFEWGDDAYIAEAPTFGIETFEVFDSGATTAVTFLNGPSVTLNFPDSSTASFQAFLKHMVQTQPPESESPPIVYSTALTVGPWNVNLW